MRVKNIDRIGRVLLWVSITISIHCQSDCNCYAELHHNSPRIGIDRDDCGEPSVSESVLIQLISNPKNLRIQSPSNRGNFQIHIQENEFTLNAGEMSNRFGIRPTSGIYKIKSDSEGMLLDQATFDFSKSIRDGVIVRNEFTLDPDRCYLLNGISGNAVEKDCAVF